MQPATQMSRPVPAANGLRRFLRRLLLSMLIAWGILVVIGVSLHPDQGATVSLVGSCLLISPIVGPILWMIFSVGRFALGR
jgi:hypothetical protein